MKKIIFLLLIAAAVNVQAQKHDILINEGVSFSYGDISSIDAEESLFAKSIGINSSIYYAYSLTEKYAFTAAIKNQKYGIDHSYLDSQIYNEFGVFANTSSTSKISCLQILIGLRENYDIGKKWKLSSFVALGLGTIIYPEVTANGLSDFTEAQVGAGFAATGGMDFKYYVVDFFYLNAGWGAGCSWINMKDFDNIVGAHYGNINLGVGFSW